jgi:hypothetical protein
MKNANKTAKVEHKIPLGGVADLSIVREAQRELGTMPRSRFTAGRSVGTVKSKYKSQFFPVG